MNMLLVAIAFGVAALATFLCRAAARRTGFVSHPDPNVATHTSDVAYLGGLGVAIGIAAAMIGTPTHRAFAIGALLFLILGLLDDALTFRPAVKLAGQIISAGVAVALGAGASWHPLTALMWILVLVNAVNMTDVCDGLAAGIAVPAFVACALLVPAQSPLALAAVGACCGFLLFNRPPASIYLGDAGAHVLGFLLAALTMAQEGAGSILRTALIAGVFLFELLFLCAMRMRRGRPPWIRSPDHFSLRLQSRGWTRVQVDLAAIAAASILCGLAVADLRPAIAVSIAAVCAIAAWIPLARMEPR